ncbi:putative eka-like protein [Erysiphe necator]|uniref:Putative eka-like protein n=1 Tax=Uncinula necator TaxID=52586 RepID=A0A0B1P2I1_UNCNE|nr:putative eka-like protein [Erysiphe necator]
MICTTVLSNIECTLANLTEDIEKEDAEAIKAYLRLAISNFAAADSSPSSPRKIDDNLTKKIAVATPQLILNQGPGRELNINAELPRIPKLSDNSWATVARKGQKKSRIDISTSARVAPANKTAIRPTNKDKTTSPTKAISDNRFFLRLPQEHEWHKLSPAGIPEVIVKKLLISPSLMRKIKPVNSGFALSPCSSEAREQILKAENGLFLSGAKLEPATNWVSILVPTDEIERVYSVRPVHLELYGRNNPEAPHRTWMALFAKAPRTGFRVFDESGIGMPFKKQHTLEFCKRCNGHHATKNCSRAPSCGNCGSTNHVENKCMAATKCRNCGGPHRSESRRCLVRPTRLGAPTEEQMKMYRQAGEREYQAIVRAREAETRAEAAMESTFEPIYSQSTVARPQAVTYKKKDPKNIHAMQIFPHSEITGDYCWVVINIITFLNLYKAPQYPAAVQPLLSWTPTGTVAAGDFNSVHWVWQPGVTKSYGQGEEIEIWAEMHNLSSLIIGEPTHLDRDECVTSDHYPISGIVHCQRQKEANKKGPLNVSDDQLPHFAKVVSQWLPSHTSLISIDEIEKATEEICRVIKEAIKAVGRHKNRGKGRSGLWWTSEYKAAYLQYHNAVTKSERS